MKTYALPDFLYYDKLKTAASCFYKDLIFEQRYCIDPLYEDEFEHFITSEFYTDNNNDGVIHIPVFFGDDGVFTDAKYSFDFGKMLI